MAVSPGVKSTKKRRGPARTVGRLHPHVVEGQQRGALDNDLDRLLAVCGAHVSLPHRFFGAEGAVEGEVVGPGDLHSGHAVIVQLPRTSRAIIEKIRKAR